MKAEAAKYKEKLQEEKRDFEKRVRATEATHFSTSFDRA